MRSEHAASKLRSQPSPKANHAVTFMVILGGLYVGTLPARDSDEALHIAAMTWANGDDVRVEVALTAEG
jgi:hypothetical protein